MIIATHIRFTKLKLSPAKTPIKTATTGIKYVTPEAKIWLDMDTNLVKTNTASAVPITLRIKRNPNDFNPSG